MDPVRVIPGNFKNKRGFSGRWSYTCSITLLLSQFSVTSNQIERLWSRFTSLDKQQKGYLTREDFLRIPELAINPLGDRIVHAFFRDSSAGDDEEGVKFSGGGGGVSEKEVVNFCDFVRVLAHFRPIKKNVEKNKMNSRQEKLRCKCIFQGHYYEESTASRPVLRKKYVCYCIVFKHFVTFFS